MGITLKFTETNLFLVKVDNLYTVLVFFQFSNLKSWSNMGKNDGGLWSVHQGSTGKA